LYKNKHILPTGNIIAVINIFLAQKYLVKLKRRKLTGRKALKASQWEILWRIDNHTFPLFGNCCKAELELFFCQLILWCCWLVVVGVSLIYNSSWEVVPLSQPHLCNMPTYSSLR